MVAEITRIPIPVKVNGSLILRGNPNALPIIMMRTAIIATPAKIPYFTNDNLLYYVAYITEALLNI